MIEANKAAFSNLVHQYQKYGDEQVDLNGVIYITTTSEEKKWLKHAEILNYLFITPSIRLVEVQFDEEKYFAVIGANIETRFLDASVVSEIDVNAGIITLLLSDGFLKLNRYQENYQEFYNEILFQHIESGYAGHDHIDLLPFLEKTFLFHLPEDSIIKSNAISRFACYLFANDSSQLVLDYDNRFLTKVVDVVLEGLESISYHILVNCLFSNTYNHAFLELYRLVERLFPVSYLKELHLKMGTNLSFIEFSSELENVTKWRPREDNAIEKIFLSTHQEVKIFFEEFMQTSPELESQNHSNYFYALRNSIVHFRSNHSELKLDAEQWNKLLLATLHLVSEQYKIYDEILVS